MDKIYDKLEYPQTLFLEPTNHCNIRCSICPYPTMKRSKGYINWETLERVIGESKGKSKICFFMGFGEPLLHPEIIEMIEYIENAGISVYLSTNSMLLDEGMAEMLFDVGLTRLYLPFSTFDKEKYEAIRRGACFDVVKKNINHCLQVRKNHLTKTKVLVIPIAMKETFKEFDEIVEYYQPMLDGIGGVELKGFCDYSGAVEDRSIPGLKSPPGFCTMVNYGITINWNGDVVICCNDYDNFTSVGSVLNNSISEIWSSDKYNEYRRQIKERNFQENSFCGGCLGA